MKRRFWSLVVILLLLVCTVIVIDPFKRKTDIGAWYYPIINPQVDMPLDFVLLSVNGRQLNTVSNQYNQSYKDFIASQILYFQSKSIEVRLMTLEDPVFTFMNTSNSILEHLQGVFSVMQEFSLQEFQIDIEPHALSAWKNGTDEDRINILQEFISVVNFIYSQKDDYTLSVAVTWWLPKKYVLADMQADILYLMIYGGTGGSYDAIINRVYADRNFYIGMGVREYNTTAELITTSTQIQNHFADTKDYLGNTYFSLNQMNKV